MADTTFKKNCATAAALYVHVPFCRAKCRYCDFYSLADSPGYASRYVRALGRELDMVREVLTVPVESVFVGGGTPTALPATQLSALLSLVQPLIDDETEFTVEANPSTVDARTAAALARGSVNRVSVGVQSFQVAELAALGRLHTPSAPSRAVRRLRSEGIDNIGIDLIYGIAGQTTATWQRTLRRGIGLGIEHLSCYALTIEPDTPLGRDVARGAVTQVDDALQREMYDVARRAAAASGLEHYEISNFARKRGKRCRQNLTYWRNEAYVGIGPAAASYVGGVRSVNLPDLQAYLAALEAGRRPPCSSERLTGRRHMAETVMLALRMTQGLDRHAFAARFGRDVLDVFPLSLKRYEALGAVRIGPTHVRLSAEAFFVSDTVLADILAEV